MQTEIERERDRRSHVWTGRTDKFLLQRRQKKMKTQKRKNQQPVQMSKIPAKTNLSKWKWNGIARNQRRQLQRQRRRLNSDSMESDEERCSHVTHVKWHWNWKWSYFTFHSYNSTTITTTTVTAPPSWRWFLYILPMVVQWVMEQYLGYTAGYTILRWHLLF